MSASVQQNSLLQDKQSLLIFIILCFLWSFTWIMGKYQVNAGILPELAVAYRFLPVSIIFFIICKIFKHSLKITKKDAKTLFIYAVFASGINFIIFYYAAIYIITSVSAGVFSLSIIIIALIQYFLKLKKQNLKPILFSAICGTIGLIFIMWQKLSVKFELSILIGFALAIIATTSYSIGCVFYEKQKPKLQINAVPSFVYVCLFAFIISFSITLIHSVIFRVPLNLIPNISLSFIISYGYLVFSAFGVLFFMILIQRIGAVQSAYVNLITPVFAVLTSAIIEDYKITIATVVGVLLVLFSNYIMLRFKK